MKALLILLCFMSAVAAQDPAVDEDPVALNNQAVKLHKEGRYAEAIKIFDRAIDLQRIARVDPDPAIVRNLVNALIGRVGKEISGSRFAVAERTLHRARSLSPEHALVHAYLGVVAYRQGYFPVAMDFFHDALRFDEKSAIAHEFIGMIHYKRETLERALDSWKTAIAIDPGRAERLQKFIQKAEREIAFESGMRTERSTHFVCKFGDEHGRSIANEILGWLEDAHGEVGVDLKEYPSETLSAVLYSDREFNVATGAHGWAAGLFDGKIRIPVKNFELSRREIRNTIFHEYTHFLVGSMTPHCPAWLNEGLAQLAEGRTARRVRTSLSRAKKAGTLRRLSTLTKTFAGIKDRNVVTISYAASLSFTSFLRDKYKQHRINLFLRAIDRPERLGSAFEDAFRRKLEVVEKLWLASL